MDFIPCEGGPQHPTRHLERIIVVGLAVLGLVIGAVSLLARPTVAGPRPPTSTVGIDRPAGASVGMPANADTDVGPGEAESELARLPEPRR
jgi:hypothetical protein